MLKKILPLVINKPFAIVGAIYTAYKALRTLHTLYRQIRPGYNLKARYGEADSYALVTGATDGIGRAFCEELARRGFNIVIVGRNLKKAQDLARELTSQYRVKTRIVLADFAHCNEEGFFDDLLAQITDLDIALLVNNFGLYIPWGTHIHKFSNAQVRDFVLSNVLPQTILSIRLAAKMQNRKKRSGIINLSSFAAEYGQGIYGATKSYNDTLSRAHSLEYAPKIDVMSLRPRFVRTPMNNYANLPFSISSQECATAALKRFGKEVYTNGHWKHGIQSYAHGLLPPDLAHQYRWYVACSALRGRVQNIDSQKYDILRRAIASDLNLKVISIKISAKIFEESLNYLTDLLQLQRVHQGDGNVFLHYAPQDVYLEIFRKEENSDAIEQEFTNPIRYFEISYPLLHFIELKSVAGNLVKSELYENGVSSLLLEIGGYRFKVTCTQQIGASITAVSLFTNNYAAQKYFWRQKLCVDYKQQREGAIQLKDRNGFVLEFVRTPQKILDTDSVAIRISVPNPQLVENIIVTSETGTAQLSAEGILHVGDVQGYRYTFLRDL